MACSISSLTFANDPTQYYIVGTAFVLPEEMEPSKVSRPYRLRPLARAGSEHIVFHTSEC